jgi:hypothetical protein
LQSTKFQRLYILLRPCAQGGGGYARLEQARGKYILTVSAHGFSPQEEGIRVLLASRDGGSGAVVCDLGLLPISEKGQASLKREVAVMPGGLPLCSYGALCIAKDWPTPRLLFLGWSRDALNRLPHEPGASPPSHTLRRREGATQPGEG